jgi:hypothetical protein
MSKSVLVAASLGLALAALAPNAALARGNEMGRVADELSNPKNQRAVAGMMEAMSEMLLSMKVAPLAKAMEQMGNRETARSIPRNATLADLAGPEARRMPREISQKVPMMMGAMAGMSEAMEAMLPQLEAMAEKMKNALPADALPAATGDE